jgi:hypothetical protein
VHPLLERLLVVTQFHRKFAHGVSLPRGVVTRE